MPDRDHRMDRIADREAVRLHNLEKEAEEAMRNAPPPGMRRIEPAEFRRLYHAGRLSPETVRQVMEAQKTDDDPTGVYAVMEMLEEPADGNAER